MKTLVNFNEAEYYLKDLEAAFEEFEEALTQFQIAMDSGDFMHEEAAEAVEDDYCAIRKAVNNISASLKNAELNLEEADKDYDYLNDEEEEEE